MVVPAVNFVNVEIYFSPFLNSANWIVWQYEQSELDKKPRKVPYQINGYRASVTDPNHWSTYWDCKYAIEKAQGAIGLGLVFSSSLGLFGIDLDATSDQVAILRQQNIADTFVSYAERSPSGQGLHIICRGQVPSGRRRDSIELYGEERYFTVTGDVYAHQLIEDYHQHAQQLWEQMAPPAVGNSDGHAGTGDQIITDDELIQRAGNAKNGELFNALFNGNWQPYYPSQSEADQAFLNIVAFYTRNDQQCRNVFFKSQLGLRPKAKRGNYLEPMIRKARDQQTPLIDTSALQRHMEAMFKADSASPRVDSDTIREGGATTLATPLPIPTAGPARSMSLMTRIYDYAMASAPYPKLTIAQAVAFALMAGVCGRSYNVSASGLNLYTMLLAPTGAGKDHMSSVASRLFGAAAKLVPSANDFLGPRYFASEPALARFITHNPSPFCIFGEFGKTLAQMSHLRASPAQLGLQKAYLEIYGSSGKGKVWQRSIYSDSEKNTKVVESPSLTILGESTVEGFYANLTREMIYDGLLPRFLILESNEENFYNDQPQQNIPDNLIQHFAELCAHSLSLSSRNEVVNVQLSPDAQRFSEGFRAMCAGFEKEELLRAIWSRSHLKALKLAALFAVGENYVEPVVSGDHFIWAGQIVEASSQLLCDRFIKGDTGNNVNDMVQERVLFKIFTKFIQLNETNSEFKLIDRQNIHDQIISFSFITKYAIKNSCFAGSKDLIKKACLKLCDEGYIVLCKGSFGNPMQFKIVWIPPDKR